MEIKIFYNEAVLDSDELTFGEGLVRCGCVVETLIDSHIEALECLVRFLQLSEFGVISCAFHGRDMCIVSVEGSNELDHRG